MLNFIKYANTDAVTIKLLKLLGQHVSSADVINELEKHPDYPNLLAISDVLSWFKIDNGAYSVSHGDLIDVPVPFIAHTNKGDNFVVINKITKEKITLSDDKRSNYHLSPLQFENIYTGTVLATDAKIPKSHLRLGTLKHKFLDYKSPLAIAGLLMSFLLIMVYNHAYIHSLNWQIALITLFKTAGLIVSILLLIQSIDQNNPLIQAVCGGGGKTNCNAILTSKAASVFDGLSWSEVGFFYFSGSWLFSLFGGGSIAIIQTLAFLSSISLPYTFYSINYQARIAKQWCVFCVTVQALLWLEFLTLFSVLRKPLKTLTLQECSILLICFVAPLAIWLITKPLLLKGQKLRRIGKQLRQFKYNAALFYDSLKEQPKYASPSQDWSIVLGNQKADTIITMVSNPYCPPCSKMHQELEGWLKGMPDIQLRIVFTANNHDEDVRTPVARHLMALNAQKDKSVIKQALHDWYEQKQKTYEAWAEKYPVVLDESKFVILEQQRAWCDVAEVKVTPTMLINGHRLPENYQMQDIKYMLHSN